MLYIRCRFALVFILLVIDNACSVSAHEDQISHVSMSERKTDEGFFIGLNDERRNTSVMSEDEELSTDKPGRSFTDTKEFAEEKMPRTFLGPLSLEFKDKLNPKRGIIYDTRDSFGGGSISGSSCCGSRYGGASYSKRPEYVYSAYSGGGRYPSRPVGRPDDRYGTPTSSYPSGLTGSISSGPENYDYSGGSGGLYPTRHGPPRGNYGGGSDGDRYGDPRPGFGDSSSSNPTGSPSRPGGLYGRPSFSVGGAGGYGGYGNVYGGIGQSDGGGSGGHRPDGGSYPGSSQGSHGESGPGSFWGVSHGAGGHGSLGANGGFGSTDDYGAVGDSGYGGGGAGGGGMISHSAGAHLQTQKALALKALAGVALIGAAAALAANPVLLPLAIAHGRKRRSAADHFGSEHPLMLLKQYTSQIPKNNVKRRTQPH